MQRLLLIILVASGMSTWPASAQVATLKIGVAGLSHGHVHWVFSSARENPQAIQIVGIAESNPELITRFMKQYRLRPDLFFPTLEKMVDATAPEAVTAFNSIDEHLNVVRVCAPRKIHVMVEKPLAVSLAHGLEMKALAEKHKIYLLTNYETNWYQSHYEAFRLIHEKKAIGPIRKVVVHDGHQGPREIGVDKEFLHWLTNPEKNGGGALMDFGCYGANLITWLMKGRRPQSVMAVTQQMKPDIYPDVDDEATVIVTYPDATGIIQASWNWPYSRKDIEIYGVSGALKADRASLSVKIGETAEELQPMNSPAPPLNDPFLYLAAVIRGTVSMSDNDLSSLALNITAMEILDAAARSASSGKRIYFK